MRDSLLESWTLAEISEISRIVYGKDLSKKSISNEGDYPVFGANSIIGYYKSYLYEKKQVLMREVNNT